MTIKPSKLCLMEQSEVSFVINKKPKQRNFASLILFMFLFCFAWFISLHACLTSNLFKSNAINNS